jgi:glycosyltransferase involved in cell wall biosynthesis
MVTPFYYPIIGGTETAIEKVSIKLNELGVPTDIMTLNFSEARKPLLSEKKERINGVNVIKIPALNLFPRHLHVLNYALMINFIPRRFTNLVKSYDIVHFHNDVELSLPFFSHGVEKPKIFHCHTLAVTYNIYKKNFLSRYIFKNVADLYVAVAHCIQKLLVDLGIPKNKIRVVHNGINVEEFRPNEEAKIDNLLLFAGRLDSKKGLPVLIKSLYYLKVPVQLVIIGPYSSEHEYSEKVLMLAEKANRETFHTVKYLGVQEGPELIKWYQKASIFVCPSLSESFPMVNLEALACETPVVASCVGGIPEVIHNYENGILIPPNDPVKLSKGIQFLIDNDEIRRRFGKEGRKLVIQNFSSETTAKKLLEIYNELIS